MLTTRDVIAGKIAVQMELANAQVVQTTLRGMDVEAPGNPNDLINRLYSSGHLPASTIEFLRHRVALYEHVRWEAVYVRLLERGTTVKKEAVAKLLAEMEHTAYRKRLGDVLVQRGNLKSEYDKKIVEKQRRLIQKDDVRILERYRATDFAGVNKPLIPNSRLEPQEFRISVLFRSKETRALVDKAELDLLRAEAAAAHALQEQQSTVMIPNGGVTPDAAEAEAGAEDKTMILDAPQMPGSSGPAISLDETTKLPPGSVAQTKAAMASLPDPVLVGRSPPSGSGEIVALDGHGQPGADADDEDEDEPEESTPPPAKPARKGGGTQLATLEDVGKLERIGDYIVVEVLGVGGMGAVFLGQKEGAGEYVAIKVMLQTLASDEERGRFEREIALAQRVNQESVLHVIEAGQTDEGLTFMVVPALAGKELRDLIDLSPGNGLAPALVLTILRQLLRGMQAVHEAGVVHRDLKPENVFVLAGGLNDIKLMDFGLAKPSADEPEEVSSDQLFRTSTGEVSGSPAYIAPESITCDPVDARTDIYSLGVMLYEMLTGKLPLFSETSHGFLSQHLICPPMTLAEGCDDYHWPDEVEDLLARMMGKARDERPDSCAQILEELDNGLAAQILHLRAKEDDIVMQRTMALPSAPKGTKKGWGFKGLLGRLWGSE